MSSSPSPSSNLRIACLEPSATVICEALGLADYIVGVTHECDASNLSPSTDRLTRNGLNDDMTQGEIHAAVQASRTKGGPRVVHSQNDTAGPSSLYPLLQDRLEDSQPTVVLTQNLCSVCAPTVGDVKTALHGTTGQPTVVSLQPHTLHQVADTFVTVAQACGVIERGWSLRDRWLSDLETLRSTIHTNRATTKQTPSLLVLEWLDPPFDGGHWNLQMMDYACVERRGNDKNSNVKSTAMEWSTVETQQPDVVLVGCCGFDLERNVRDIQQQQSLLQRHLSPSTHVVACDGNRFIAQPSPLLLQGAVIMAKAAYHDQPAVLEAIDRLGFFATKEEEETAWRTVDIFPSNSPEEADIEDLAITAPTFAQVHAAACKAGQTTYDDPATGYKVFTALAHQKRGWCCGSGCRHCPYSHTNIKDNDKMAKIQQPAFLYQQELDSTDQQARLFSIRHHDSVKVLFFSGGKDSFLTIRSLVRQYEEEGPFGLVLLTTFDATTRQIAHQNVPIDDVVRQAQHLQISLVGVPLRRNSGEAYVERIELGLKVIQQQLLKLHDDKNGDSQPPGGIVSLVFGDLHLEHIKEWRDNVMADLGFALEYPLWKVPYEDLMSDLEASRVPCFLSAATVDGVDVGMPFDRKLYAETAPALHVDGFGECGEFHSIAQVWSVPRETALGESLR